LRTTAPYPPYAQMVYTVKDQFGNIVIQSGPNLQGNNYDSGCMLFCGMQYTVEAVDLATNTVFTPQTVTLPCCPQAVSLYFQ
ncbi:MAG: hypothetical protein N2Z21_09920, partial [Candidatus Sumerlaeaceae bacterium]|nr:hypothetical protein [Candidatus Sumerlaeaceae bacterium]